jgi:hypothetical protein
VSDGPGEVEGEIAQLRAEIDARQERITGLRKLRSFPHVTPVRVFFRYCVECREDYDWSDEHNLVKAAYRSLEYGEDEGVFSSVGVEVGGVLIPIEELRDRYGRHWESDD